jgi:hypothetical protein
MRLGTENSTKTQLAIAALVVGLVWFGYVMWPQDKPSAAAAAPAANARTSGRPARAGRTVSPGTKAPLPDDPAIQVALLENSEEVKYSGAKRNIFQGEDEASSQAVQDLGKKRCKITPDAPGCPGYDPCKSNPTVSGCPGYKPPIDLKFYGFASRPGEPKRVFLSQGEQIYVAKEGDVVARRYKVVKIGVNSVQIEDMPNNNTQTIPLTAG